jgi:hypothetical protein
MGVDMKALKLGTSVLIGLLLGISEVSAATAEVGHGITVAPLDISGSTISTVVHATSFSLDALLDKPEITLTNGRNLMVVLDEALKLRLIAEQKLPDADKRITKSFVAYFEKTKSARVFDEVIGFDFLISSTGEIYCQTFLGENAK